MAGNANINYNNIIVKAFGKTRPPLAVWEGYLEVIEGSLMLYFKNAGPMPSLKDISSINSKVDSLLKVLEEKETGFHYDSLIQALVLSGPTTRHLKARRSKIKRTPTILTEKNKAICRHLNDIWKGYKKKNITGTYDNRLEHIKENIAEFDPKKNAGAYFIQATLREYFGVKLDCKQTKDLIQGMDK